LISKEQIVYAIVKAGGRQEKVSVGETLVVDRLDAAIGSSVTFPAVLLVDGADVTTDPKALAAVKVRS
jgi:large subunit ribosomal protein L21